MKKVLSSGFSFVARHRNATIAAVTTLALAAPAFATGPTASGLDYTGIPTGVQTELVAALPTIFPIVGVVFGIVLVIGIVMGLVKRAAHSA